MGSIPDLATTLMLGQTSNPIVNVVLLFIVIAMGVVLFIFFITFGRMYIQALSSGVKISVFAFIGMWLRRVSPRIIVDSLIMCMKAGIKDVHTNKLEAHYMARGNVRRVTQALVAAHKANIDLTFDQAAAIDLAGRDVLEAVRTSVLPKVIDAPSREGTRTTVDAVAGDGIQLRARARVTVRTNLARLVGGATEETIIARVGEGIVSAIGSCQTHKDVLSNPMLIARTVLDKGLDSSTAYEIVSIDIADIDVGDNVGARLQADQAEADLRIARAKAEERRAMAVAEEQEMRALTQENQAEVVLAEAEIPRALSAAYRDGKLRATDT